MTEIQNDVFFPGPYQDLPEDPNGPKPNWFKTKILGPIERGFARSRLAAAKSLDSLKLDELPEHVSYRAALVREKLMMQHLSLILLFLLVAVFIQSRIEIGGLQERLRTKEFILAPGVTDYLPVSPGTVPDSYVQHAVSDFVDAIGNVNPTNIAERYSQIASVMSPALQVQFNSEGSEWIERVLADNISEITTIISKRIEVDPSGHYFATVKTRVETFIGSESIGVRGEVIEMGLKLVPPDLGKRWCLQMTSLSRKSEEAHKVSKSLEGGKKDEK